MPYSATMTVKNPTTASVTPGRRSTAATHRPHARSTQLMSQLRELRSSRADSMIARKQHEARAARASLAGLRTIVRHDLAIPLREPPEGRGEHTGITRFAETRVAP